MKILSRVEPAEVPPLAIVKSRQALLSAEGSRLHDNRRQLDRVHVEQHRERERLAALELHDLFVRETVTVKDPNRLSTRRQSYEGKRSCGVADVEQAGSLERDHHAGERSAIDG